MPSNTELEQLSKMDIRYIDKSQLIDIHDVKINHSLELKEKMLIYLEQIKNPYCFMCDNTPVQVTFNNEGKSLGELIENYLFQLKNR